MIVDPRGVGARADVLQPDLLGRAVEHRRQSRLQKIDHGLEGLLQIVVLVGRKGRRAAIVGAHHGRQLAGHGRQHLIQPFGMHHGQGAQVLQHRRPAVERLQKQEAGEGFRPAVRGLDGAHRQLIDPLIGPADQVRQPTVQPPGGAHVQRRRDVAVVHHHLAVVHFAYAGQAHAYPPVGLFAGSAIAQVQPRHLDRFGHPLAGEGVENVLLLDQQAHGRTSVFLGQEFRGPAEPSGQGHEHHRVAQVAGNVQRRRRRHVFGNGKDRAVRQHARAPLDRELAERQQVFVDGQAGQAPGIGPQARRAGAQLGFSEPVLLLEVLWAEE